MVTAEALDAVPTKVRTCVPPIIKSSPSAPVVAASVSSISSTPVSITSSSYWKSSHLRV